MSRLMLISLWIALSPLAGLAQGVVQGTISDETGAMLTDCRVVLEEQGTGILREARTNQLGKFVFAVLTKGQYRVEADVPGFDKVSSIVSLEPGQTREVALRLKVSKVEFQMAVEADPLQVSLDEAQNADATVLTSEELDLLPTLDQDLVGTASVFLGSDAPANLVVDGIERETFDLPPAAIAEIKVNQNPYSAEFSRPGRGRMEIRTKASDARFRGSAAFFLRDSKLEARNAFASRRLPFSRESLNASLSGPILDKQKLGFFVALYSMDRGQAQPVLAMLPGGLLQTDALADSNRLRLNSRLDGQATPSQTWSWQLGYRGGRDENEGVGGLNLPERAQDTSDKEIESTLSWTSVVSATAVNQFRAHFEWDSDLAVPRSQAPAILVNGAFSGGGAQDQLSSRTHEFEAQDVYAVSRGKHSVRLGGGSRIRLFDTENRSNFGGTFEFASLDDFLNQQPLFFRRNEGDPRLAFRQSEIFGFVQEEWRALPELNVSLGLRYEAQTGVNDFTNFGPRAGLAWSPGKDRKTVLRSGFGIFFERRTASLLEESLQFDGRRTRSIIITNPGYPDPLVTAGKATLLPPSVVSLDPNLRSPYALVAGLALERQLVGKTLLVLEYNVQRGRSLFRSRNLNAPLPGTGVRPRPELGNLNQFESSASSLEQGVSVTLRGRWKGGDFSTQYRYRRSFSDTEEADFLPANNFDLRPEWGRTENDRRHRLRVTGTFKLPRGFSAGLISSFGSSRPFDVTTGSDDNGDTVVSDRPPNVTRNTGQGAGSVNVDIRLGREWVLREVHGHKVSLEAAGEVFNLFNHTNLLDFVGNLRSPFFGSATSARDPRQVQLSVKVRF